MIRLPFNLLTSSGAGQAGTRCSSQLISDEGGTPSLSVSRLSVSLLLPLCCLATLLANDPPFRRHHVVSDRLLWYLFPGIDDSDDACTQRGALTAKLQTAHPLLVTGANRGIGFGLVEALAARDNVLVFAGARDPARADRLNALAERHAADKKVVVVKLDVTSERDAQDAAETVKRLSPKVDVLIANAGQS